MRVRTIYHEYMIPQNLQEHMLRVASFAEIILEGWLGTEIEKQAVIQACLFHDIAKPMSFDLAKQAQYGMSPIEIEQLAQLQQRIKAHYGENEHSATVKICEAIGLSSTAVDIVDNLEWKYILRLIKNAQIEPLIAIYSDMRIGPKGVLSLKERLEDLKSRAAEDFDLHSKNGQELEKLIVNSTNVDLESIHDQHLHTNFEKLLNADV